MSKATGKSIEPGDRIKCRKCDRGFTTEGKHNRICKDCRLSNNRATASEYFDQLAGIGARWNRRKMGNT